MMVADLLGLTARTLVTASVPLAAAFGGAWFAFRLESRAAERRLRNKHLSAANQAQFTLLRQATYIRAVQRDYVDPHRDEPGRWLRIKGVVPISGSGATQDYEALGFLVGGEHTLLVQDLFHLDLMFNQLAHGIDRRSGLHQRVLNKLVEGGVELGVEFGESDAERILGTDYYELVNATNDTIEEIDRFMRRVDELSSEFAEAMGKMFSRSEVFNFQPSDD